MVTAFLGLSTGLIVIMTPVHCVSTPEFRKKYNHSEYNLVMNKQNRRKPNQIELLVAERIKRAWLKNKKRLELSQERAAEKLGWSQALFNKYLNGKNPLNINAVLKFSELLGMPASELAPELLEKHSTNLDDIQKVSSDSLSSISKVNIRDIVEILSDFPESEIQYVLTLTKMRKALLSDTDKTTNYLIPEGSPIMGETTLATKPDSKQKAG